MKGWFLSVFPAFVFSSVFVVHLCAQNPFDETVRLAAHFEPAIPHPEQSKVAKDKLASLRAKTGRPPNILVLLVDDMGWGDILPQGKSRMR